MLADHCDGPVSRRAYEGDFGQFFGIAGEANLMGSDGGWEPTVANFDAGVSDTGDRLWSNDFQVEGPILRDGPQIAMRLKAPRTIKVPLWPVKKGHLFVVHVSLDAEAADDRGGESAVQAFIEDPQHRDPALIRTHGLQALGKPKIKEPAVKPPPAARCSGGQSPKAGVMQLGRSVYTAGENHRRALVQVTRTGGSRGAASVEVDTTGGSAQSGSDFTSTSTRVRFGNRDASPRFVEIPIRQDATAESPEKFTVSLSHVRCAKLGSPRSATVTILDDDQPPPPPPPEFTIGGTVDGLQGSGLVLSNLGAPLRISGNGSFTFPGTATTDQPYEVTVATQPSNPGQVCAVEHGTGTVSLANVTDVAVHCAAPVIPRGLDSGFGDGGRVSTPIGEVAQGEAVVIQPDGKIVTAGSAGTQLTTDFGLTRHDDAGHLDPSFGVGGIVTTDLGGTDDKAFDAALDPNGGIVAVGRTDARGVQKTDFGVVDYLPDGSPNPNFGNHGIVTTEFFGKGAQANAVAIQGDKILVAGFAHQANGIDSDFALARYNLDGSLDTNFGDNGIVATDLGTENDDATSLAIQPDGKIVLAGVAGVAGDNVALARYNADGCLDLTFNNSGKTVGFFGVANGVTVTAGGTILIAGEEVGASQTQDFMLASYGPNGTLNKGFGNFGAVTTDLSQGPDYAQDLAIAPDGRIFVVGQATSSTVTDMALVAYNPDGTVNDSFIADFRGLGDFGQDLAFDSQGRLVVAGSTENGGNTEFALMRVFPKSLRGCCATKPVGERSYVLGQLRRLVDVEVDAEHRDPEREPGEVVVAGPVLAAAGVDRLDRPPVEGNAARRSPRPRRAA